MIRKQLALLLACLAFLLPGAHRADAGFMPTPVVFFPTTAYLKSVQPIQITIPASSTSGSTSISSVGSNAFLLYDGFTQSDSGTTTVSDVLPRLSISGTTVTATRGGSGSNTITVRATVVDPASLVQSVQYGSIALNSSITTNTATISAVDTSRSAVFFLGSTTSVSSHLGRGFGGVALTNPTTVTATIGTAQATTINFEVIQFAPGLVKSLQQYGTASASTATTENQTLSTTVTTANCMVAYGGQAAATDTLANFLQWGNLGSSTTYTLRRSTGSSSSHTPFYSIVEFVPGVLKSNQGSSVSIGSGVTSATATLGTAVNTSKAALNWTGLSTTAANPDEAFSAAALTDGSTVTGYKNTAGTLNSQPGWQVLEFN